MKKITLLLSIMVIVLFTTCVPIEGVIEAPAITKTLEGMSLSDAANWIGDHAASGSNYTIILGKDESCRPINLSYKRYTNITITIKSDGNSRTVSLASVGSLFTVRSGVTLVLEDNIILKGRNDNTSILVVIKAEGTFVLNGGTISNNNDCGVYVDKKDSSYHSRGGKFIMMAGTISDNAIGVAVDAEGVFEMSSGTIDGNTKAGIAVYEYGTFTMSGGTISNNTVGGVRVSDGGNFTMAGGTISGNTAYDGGGVYVGGAFKKTGGTIYGSDASAFLQNKATRPGSPMGHAVYASSTKKRNTTAGQTVNLDSSISGSAGGWE